jgi:hypothetical protein
MPTDAENQAAAEEAIPAGLLRPKRLRSSNNEEIEERSTKEAIEAASYFAGKVAQSSGRSGLTIRQMVPGGCG